MSSSQVAPKRESSRILSPPAAKQMFIKTFKEICGSGASRHRIFSDWLECAAIALHQLPYHAQEFEKDKAYHRLEQIYLDRIQPYKLEQLHGFSHLLSITMLALQEPCCDFLGEIYAELELAKAHAGQFFTPYPVSRTMAMLCMGDLKTAIAQQGIVTIEEPAVGSGGCLVAAAQAAYKQHIDPRCSLQMRAVDIDRDCFNMTYIQLSCLGLQAIVSHGNTLTLETWEARPTMQLRCFWQWMDETGLSRVVWMHRLMQQALDLEAPAVTANPASAPAQLPTYKQPSRKTKKPSRKPELQLSLTLLEPEDLTSARSSPQPRSPKLPTEQFQPAPIAQLSLLP
ncbi:N-6 DNA methylase [Microcoleus sp. FACHB-1515]|uniref:N-6 DNA methylase n=1 Tax=Cyanophyceae TaxID=3028117 RepID=UPI0016846160|nr:N-6 DNA methylase [Microcoleus sp. FACHB-1515]MBD2093223.1 N-6 DNA methylase [Microcoleus sp. FACHB-1515]